MVTAVKLQQKIYCASMTTVTRLKLRLLEFAVYLVQEATVVTRKASLYALKTAVLLHQQKASASLKASSTSMGSSCLAAPIQFFAPVLSALVSILISLSRLIFSIRVRKTRWTYIMIPTISMAIKMTFSTLGQRLNHTIIIQISSFTKKAER